MPGDIGKPDKFNRKEVLDCANKVEHDFNNAPCKLIEPRLIEADVGTIPIGDNIFVAGMIIKFMKNHKISGPVKNPSTYVQSSMFSICIYYNDVEIGCNGMIGRVIFSY